MNENNEWGIEKCKVVVEIVKEWEEKGGEKGLVRIKKKDKREGEIGENMYRGIKWEKILKEFEGRGKEGEEILDIENWEGKEVNEEGNMLCEIEKCLLYMDIISCRDMRKNWKKIVEIDKK